MKRYKVWVCLEADYDNIIATDEEDAFVQASDFAMSGGSWQMKVEELEDLGDNIEEED